MTTAYTEEKELLFEQVMNVILGEIAHLPDDDKENTARIWMDVWTIMCPNKITKPCEVSAGQIRAVFRSLKVNMAEGRHPLVNERGESPQ